MKIGPEMKKIASEISSEFSELVDKFLPEHRQHLTYIQPVDR
jgi:hypothetical protein